MTIVAAPKRLVKSNKAWTMPLRNSAWINEESLDVSKVEDDDIEEDSMLPVMRAVLTESREISVGIMDRAEDEEEGNDVMGAFQG